ncbi:Hypothetical predicted protein [Olea europaea subsp. europaea]|uniref:Uncharacterized protein n=1 Tax=Olea europaea subsp. europaea TaxID=158383 RepID=A0A8S0SIH0_OLEEU|nr:Hypothetical predicted protein [Olea europaea subsp. europaea]
MGNSESSSTNPRFASANRAFSQNELEDLRSLFTSLAAQSQTDGKYVTPSVFKAYIGIDGPLEDRMFDLMTQKRKDQKLEGKVAIIAGGASGFGENSARNFALHGTKVVIADVQDDKSDNDVKNIVDFTMRKHGKLDIMFNNAGIPGNIDFSIIDSDSENFKRVFDGNVFGEFLGSNHAARAMILAKIGVILFTSSNASIVSGEFPHSYAVSKHAVVGLMKNVCGIRAVWDTSELHITRCGCGTTTDKSNGRG